jgi:hypothetical protein
MKIRRFQDELYALSPGGISTCKELFLRFRSLEERYNEINERLTLFERRVIRTLELEKGINGMIK